MIVKIKILDVDNKEFVMLFGTSYKNYLDQIRDFFYRSQEWINHMPHPAYSILNIETSKSRWMGWGGLKWCEEKDFQEHLNREGCQYNDPDNPRPRQYSKMKFEKNYYVANKIKDWHNRQYQERQITK